MTEPWRAYREPLRSTLLRTGVIALVVGAVAAWRWGRLSRWPMATLLVFWFSFGGHWVEVWFLNWLRPRLSRARRVQIGARPATWFVGGTALAFGMALTATALGGMRPGRWASLWIGGFAFIAVELIVHLILYLRGQGCFYNGRG